MSHLGIDVNVRHLRRETRSDEAADHPSFIREFDKIVRRRSFNPNETAPPRPTDLGTVQCSAGPNFISLKV